MKIAREFSADTDVRRRAQLIAVLQSHFDLAALRFGNDGEHAIWPKRDDWRRLVVNENSAERRIARIKPRAVDHDFAARNRERRVYLRDFTGSTHKNRSSYVQKVYSTTTLVPPRFGFAA